jgi:hypothetical protein
VHKIEYIFWGIPFSIAYLDVTCMKFSDILKKSQIFVGIDERVIVCP